jgi:hypothetical protein
MNRQDIVTGGRGVCHYCGQTLTEVQDPYSWVLDYSADEDFGCDDNPISDSEGVGSHAPVFLLGESA